MSGRPSVLDVAGNVRVLRQQLGDEVVLVGDAIPAACHTDWSGFAPARPAAWVRPRNTEEVARTLALCHELWQPVVPQGGLTGLVGGAVPRPDDVALSLARMNRIEELDPAAASITVQAGVTLQCVQQAAEDAGLMFALDLGARGTCQIGGNLATNAGGHNVLRHGMARDQVLGLEVVLADGSVVGSLRKMVKDNAGYDLRHLFVGSEGTLGVITRAVLRLQPRPRQVHTMLASLPGFDEAVRWLRALQQRHAAVSAFELMWPDFYQLAHDWHPGHRAPPPDARLLRALVEVDADPEALQDGLARDLGEGLLSDVVLAGSLADARGLWALREITAEFPSRLDPVNFDVSMEIGRIGDFAERCRHELQRLWPGHRSVFFGHVGDGNLHLTVDARSLPAGVGHDEVDAVVYGLLAAVGGSVSAEHGIGLLKRRWLACSRTDAELALMRRIKRTLDPHGILNPGKVLEAEGLAPSPRPGPPASP